MNILETENLSKKYKGKDALKDVSLSVRGNTVYGLLGPNGSGKSTLLKILAGIATPTSGKIIFNNHPWSREDLSKIGSLIESPPLYPNLTVVENLELRSILLGISKDRIQDVLNDMGLENEKNKRASELSLGMKQRLGIALALLNRPKLLLLDEPTNGLDPMGIETLRKMIRDFVQSKITVIISSHILNEVQKVADDIGIIYQGKLLYQNAIDQSENLEDLFYSIIKKECDK